MNIWLLSLGVVGVVGALVWYVVLLRDFAPGLRVPFLSKGDIPQRSIYLWLLVVMLSESVAVNAFDEFRGFGVLGGVALAFALSEVARWWHNRSVPAVPAEPPADWFPDPGSRDDAPSP